MRTSILLIAQLILFSVITANAQNWTNNLPQEKMQTGEEFTLYEIRDAFNSHWEPKNVKNGYYLEDGIKKKAAGWKQFKRWEWYWDIRVDPITGAFPKTSAADIRKQMAQSRELRNEDGKWMSLGPSTTGGGYAGLGRLNCVAFVETDPDRIYVGSPSGGLWKTTDGGVTWEVMTDENDVLGVSDILVYPGASSSTDTLYIATGDRDKGSLFTLGGEQPYDNNSIGVLKSVDGGETWSSTGMEWLTSDKKKVNRLIKHPASSDTIYAAATDGVFRTTDGGADWDTIAGFLDFIDLEMMPMEPSILYGSSTTGEIFKSYDGGDTWELMFIMFGAGRVELAVSPAMPEWLYAVISDVDGSLIGVIKSEDIGETFDPVFAGTGPGENLLGYFCDASGDTTSGQGFYDLTLAVDPGDPLTVYLGGVNTWKSIDGGESWDISNMWTEGEFYNSCSAPVAHADKHYLAFQPGTGDLFECNDGGLYKSTDEGDSWIHLGDGLVTSQIYRLGVSQTSKKDIIIGLQDNGTKSMVSGIWSDVIGGDGLECFIDYTDKTIQYGEYIYGDAYRTKDNWATKTNIKPPDSVGSVHWVAPFKIDPTTPTTIYLATDTVWKSTDQGDTWGKLGGFDTGGSSLKSLAIAPSSSDTIYAAKSSKIWASFDAGVTWSVITGALPVDVAKITGICVKHDDAKTVWVSFGSYNDKCVGESTDAGATWSSISDGIPEIPVMGLVQNILNESENELYAATDLGVYVKVGTEDWELFSEGLPNVVVTDLEIYYDPETPELSRIRGATYGRGLWESELYFPPGSDPVAGFEADDVLVIKDSTVVFTDLTVNDPDTWAWTFTPSTVTYHGGTSSTSQHPEVSFDAAGDYTVELTASNTFGSDTETKVDYISVLAPFIWKGESSSSWTLSGNWEDGSVPDETSDAIIPSGATFYPELTGGDLSIGSSSGTYKCKNLYILDGGIVSVGSSAMPFPEIDVFGDLTVETGGLLEFTSSLTVESGGKLYVTGGTVENTYNTIGGFGLLYFKSGSGGYMTSGSITVFAHIWFTGGDWYASGGAVHCGGDAYPVKIISYDYDLYLHDFIIDEDVSDSLDAVSVAPLDIRGDYTQEVGSSFSIPVDQTVEVLGDVLLKSDATGSASLINAGAFTVSGTTTIEQFIPDFEWHLIASPLGGITAATVYFGGSPEVWLKDYLEPTNTWAYITSLGTSMPLGKGFVYWIDGAARSDETIGYEGTMNSSDLTITSLDWSGDADHGYNAVGNPFPSAIDWDVGSWDTTDINGSIWVWADGGSGDGSGTYKYRNAQALGSLTDGIIPMGQGFFIQASGASPSLTIPADARVHATSSFYKSAKAENEENQMKYVVFNVLGNGLSDQSWITFCDDCNDGYDNGWDVNKLFSKDNTPQIYFNQNGFKLSIDAIGIIGEEEKIVNLDVNIGKNGEHELMLAETNLMEEIEIYLEDKLTGHMQNMKTSPEYVFIASTQDEPERFKVYLNPSVTSIEKINQNHLNIYAWNKTVNIRSNNLSSSKYIEIIDLYGKIIYSGELEPKDLNSITIDVNNAYLVVKVVEENQLTTKKLFIR